jgi:hypothetical protein
VIRQSRNIGVMTLQTQLVTGGNYVTIGNSSVSAPLGLSIVYTPSSSSVPLELEVSALIDGVIKISGSDAFARGEVWKNGVFWKSFGVLSSYSVGGDSGAQMTGTFIDTIPANSSPVTYSLQGSCFKLNNAVSSSAVWFNWGLTSSSASIGGGSTASFLKLVERGKF